MKRINNCCEMTSDENLKWSRCLFCWKLDWNSQWFYKEYNATISTKLDYWLSKQFGPSVCLKRNRGFRIAAAWANGDDDDGNCNSNRNDNDYDHRSQMFWLYFDSQNIGQFICDSCNMNNSKKTKTLIRSDLNKLKHHAMPFSSRMIHSV